MDGAMGGPMGAPMMGGMPAMPGQMFVLAPGEPPSPRSVAFKLHHHDPDLSYIVYTILYLFPSIATRLHSVVKQQLVRFQVLGCTW